VTHGTKAVVVGICLLIGSATDAAAQPLRTPRPFRGLFGGDQTVDPARVRQELTATVSVLGGYSDNLSQELGGGSFDQTTLNQSGTSGTFTGNLRYMYGKDTRRFTAIGTGFVTAYELNGTATSPGGSLQLEGLFGLFGNDRQTLTLTERVTFEPLFTLATFEGVRERQAGADLPTDDPNLGLQERRLFSSDTGAVWDLRWGRRDNTSFGYVYQNTSYADGADSFTHRALATYSRTLSRTATLAANYNFSDGEFSDGFTTRPVREQSIDVGPAFEKRVTRTRTMRFEFGLGASYVESVTSGVEATPYEYWTPYGHAGARFEIGRTWVLGGGYRRSVVVLEGLSTDAFMTDSAVVSLNGLVGSRLGLNFTGGFSNGQTDVGSGNRSKYDAISFQGEAQFALTQHLALTTQYTYYYYQFVQTTLPTGFPPQFDRYSIQGGITLRIPFYGNYVDRPGRP
jgi:hypothetical protein